MAKIRKLLQKNIILAVLGALLVVGPAAIAAPVARGVPATSGNIENTTARIVFSWPQQSDFTIAVDDRTISVTFEQDVNPDFGGLLAQLHPYIISAQRKADGKTIAFTTDQPYKVRSFKSGNSNGLLLEGIDPKKQRSRTKVATDKPAVKAEKAAEKPKAAEKKIPIVKSAELNSAKPTAGDEADKKAVPEKAQAAKADVLKPEAKTPAAKEQPKKETVKAAPKPEATPAPKEAKEEVPAKPVVAAPSEEEAKEPAPKEKPKSVASAGKLKVNVSAADDSATLRFPFTERTASAVFIRSGTLWVVFNKPVALDLSDFEGLPATVIGKAKMVTQNGITALQVPVASTVLPTIAKEAGKYEWAVLLAPKNRLLSNALSVDIKTDPPAPPHVFIPVQEMGDTLEFKDEQVGDTLVITPLFNLGEGLMHKREFVEFSLLETAQGIVVSKKSDDVKVVQLRNGLRISPNQGVTLTPGLPPVSDSDRQSQSLQSSITFFPYDAWKAPEDRERNKYIVELTRQVVEAANPEAANRVRIRLAQLYLSEGLAPEALAQLEGISRTDIVFYRSSKLAALHGAANFLMARYAEAARDFSASELNNNKEIDYWRSMLADLLGSPEPYDYLALNDDYISKYPPVFRQKLTIVAADRSVENKDYNTALKIFDVMKQDKVLDPIQDYVNYLLAVTSAATGQEDEAIKIWDKLAENDDAPFVQARAELSRILWGMEKGNINKDQAIERLERLRLSWHGDNLELKVLSLLGNLYSERNDYANAMRVWDAGVTSFPNTSKAVEMERKLEDAFVSLFDEGSANRMPPLEVLTLYYQYKTHVPGGNIGNQLVSLLADKLVSVDLLNESAALLDKQMRDSEKEQRSEVGAKLATVQLLNHNPQKALAGLQDSVYGDISQPLNLWRNRLLAQSLSELKRYDKALQIVQSDLSPDAERIRMGVYWQNRDWSHMINSVEALLKAREDVSKPLTLEESDAVLKLALAYVFEDNKAQLQYLKDYFTPLMANNPYKPLFEYVTASDDAVTPANFDAIMKDISQTRSFLDNYRARIHTAGLNNVMNNNDGNGGPAKPEAKP